MPFLQVDKLVRHFGSVRAVDDISFSLERGQSVGLIGANGAGKTTLMRLLTTLDLPDSGTITMNGVDAIACPEQVRSRIGWMPDAITPIPHMTGQDPLDIFARAKGLPGTYRRSEVQRVLAFCGIRDLAGRFINKLSKGQSQRVALARTIIGDPDFLVLDEPAAGLDPAARLEFMHFVRALQQQGKTLLISSHILSELAEMCDTMVFMDAGHIMRIGTLAELNGDEGYQFRIELAAGDSSTFTGWLRERRGWSSVVAEGARPVNARFALPDDSPAASPDELLAREVADMCAAFPICGFTRCHRRLEETFVSLLQQRHA